MWKFWTCDPWKYNHENPVYVLAVQRKFYTAKISAYRVHSTDVTFVLSLLQWNTRAIPSTGLTNSPAITQIQRLITDRHCLLRILAIRSSHGIKSFVSKVTWSQHTKIRAKTEPPWCVNLTSFYSLPMRIV